MFSRCDKEFNIKYLELEQNTCSNVISNNKDYFKENYVILDDFDEVKNKCISKFLVTTFSEGELFNVDNDFKSEINIDFSLPFYSDV